MKTIEERLDRLERQVRFWQTVGVCALALASSALLPRSGQSDIEPLAKTVKPVQVKAPFQVVSRISHRVLLDVSEDGTGAQLTLGSAFGHPSMTVASTKDGPILQLYSLQGSPNMNLTPDDLLIKDWNIGGMPSLDLQGSGLQLKNSHGVASTVISDSLIQTFDPYGGGVAATLGGFHFPATTGPVGQITGRNVAIVGADWAYPPF